MPKKRKTEFNMCSKKRKLTVRKAHKSAYFVNENFGTKAHPYHCPFCGQWHIGRNKPKRGQKFKNAD